MAYLINVSESPDTTGTSLTPPDPGGYVIGDVIAFLCCFQNTANDITTSTTGWNVSTAAGTFGNNSLGAVWRVATVDSVEEGGAGQTMPAITTGTSANLYAVGASIGDTNGVVDLQLHGATGFTTLTQAIPTSTTGAANTLGLWLCASSQWAQTVPQIGSGPLGSDRRTISSGVQSGVSSGWWFEESSGVTSPAREFWLLQAIRNRHAIVLSFGSDTGISPPRCDLDSVAPYNLDCPMHDNAGYNGYTLRSIISDVPTIDGLTTFDDSNTDTNGTGFGLDLNLTVVRSQAVSPAAGRVYARGYDLSSVVNLTTFNNIYFHYIRYGSGTDVTRSDVLNNHGIMVGLCSGTGAGSAYRFYDASALDTIPVSDGLQIVAIDYSDTTNRVGGTDYGPGTFDLTNITSVCTAFHIQSNQSVSTFFDYSGTFNRLQMIGGNTTNQKLNWASLQDSLRVYDQVIDRLGDTFESRINVQIGNGSSVCNFDTDGQSFGFPNPADFPAKTIQTQIYNSPWDITYNLTTGNTANFDAPIDFKGGTLDLSAASNANATWTFNNAVWSGVGTWNTTTDIGQVSNLIIQNSATIDASQRLDFSGGGVTITGSTGSYAAIVEGSTQAILQTRLADYVNTALNNSPTGLRIRYTGSGDIALIINGTTFSGDTVDVEYSSANASTLTITPSGGTVINTTAIDDNAVAVIVDSSTAIQLIGQFADGSDLPDGLRYRIFNNRSSSELYNDTVSGGAGLTINTLIGTGLDIQDGDSLRFMATYANGVNYLEEMEATITANVSSNVFIVNEVSWAAPESFNLDGSTFNGTVFTAVTSTDRINVLSDWLYAQFQTWWAWHLTTEDGIRNWFKAVTLLDNANARINNTLANILLDNAGTVEYFQSTPGRIFRADAARPVANPTTGGGGLDPQWLERVLTTTTGSGPLTPAQEALLTNASSQSTQAVTDIGNLNDISTDDVWTHPTRTVTDGVVIRNQPFDDFSFVMFDANGPATGLSVTGEVSIDGAAFVNIVGTISEVGNGVYAADLLASDTNGDTLMFKFSATDAEDTFLEVITS